MSDFETILGLVSDFEIIIRVWVYMVQSNVWFGENFDPFEETLSDLEILVWFWVFIIQTNSDLERILGLMSDLEIIVWFWVYIWQTNVGFGENIGTHAWFVDNSLMLSLYFYRLTLDLERILGLMTDLWIIAWFWVYICETNVWFGDTGWRRPIRCLKLQVIYRKRATNYRALLRKMTCKNKASYGFWPPCSIGPFKETLCSFERESWIFYRSFFATEPQTIGLFCRKWPIKIRDLMGFCHPVIFGPSRTHCSRFRENVGFFWERI